jgi:hypothetical protein
MHVVRPLKNCNIMKTTPLKTIGITFGLFSLSSGVFAQGTAFTYQGRLVDAGQAATGSYDFRCALFDSEGEQLPRSVFVTNSAVAVSNGLFAMTLDFGASPLSGPSPQWLEIWVRNHGSEGEFTELKPRQPLTPSPYAVFAKYAHESEVAWHARAVGENAVSSEGLQTGSVTSEKVFDGTLSAADLSSSLASNTFWRLDGNASTVTGLNFLGTLDNQPLDLRASGQRALRMEWATNFWGDAAVNLIGGSTYNVIGSGAAGSVIAGGGEVAVSVGEVPIVNRIDADYSAIGGGYGNTIGMGHWGDVIAGGYSNTIVNAAAANIGGGSRNKIGTLSHQATIAGGLMNDVGSTAYYSVIGGGIGNRIKADSGATVIAGGRDNQVAINTPYGSIGGGRSNLVSGVFGTIPGGEQNIAGAGAVVSGGYSNRATADWTVIAGGAVNEATDYSASVAGGESNHATNSFAAVGGGRHNTAGGSHSIVSGGGSNLATNEYATVPGGQLNIAGGKYSLASGYRAQSLHDGGFVWADSQSQDFSSTGSNQFLIRASGGVGIGTNNPQAALHVAGKVRADGFESAGVPMLLGTTDGQPLEFRVNNERALRLEPAGSNSINVIAGWSGNTVAAGVAGSTIGGGGVGDWNGSGTGHLIESHLSTIAGGYANTIHANSQGATLSGGTRNTVEAGANDATIGGGMLNSAAPYGYMATIGGGHRNVAGMIATIGGGSRNQALGQTSTIAGGSGNTASGFLSTVCGGDTNTASGVLAAVGGGSENTAAGQSATVSGGNNNNSSGPFATIAGGLANTAAGYAATVPGGHFNEASGEDSFAAGANAKARHAGSFVWADRTSGDFASTAENQFLIRATGGVGLGAPPQDALLDIEGNTRLNNYDLLLRHSSDRNHGLGWYGSNYINKGFAGVDVDGPVLYGYSGGVLGSTAGGQKLALRWTGNSHVGIGIANPAANLHVASPAGPASLLIGQHHQNGGYSALLMGVSAVSGGHAYLQGVKAAGSTYGDLVLNANGGKVGVGTTNLQDALHIQNSSGAFLRVDGGLNNLTGLRLCETNGLRWTLFMRGWQDEDLEFYDEAGSRMTMVLQSGTGRVGIGRNPAGNAIEVEGNASKTVAGSWLANSDARIKTDIAPITNALETLNRVRLASFRYTEDYLAQHENLEDRRYLNVIAQEFAEVFPEHVKPSGEQLPDGSAILQVDTHPLTIYSAAAVQELANTVKEQDLEIRELRQALTALTKAVQQLGR